MKERLSRRQFLKLSAAVGLSSLLLPYRKAEASSEKGETPSLIYKFETSLPEYALTIDDGYNPEQQTLILDALKELKMPATFFLVGRAVIYNEKVNPGVLQRLVDEGHYLAYHTMEHNSIEELSQVNAEWFVKDYESWQRCIKSYLRPNSQKSVKPWARAPWGLFNNAFLGLCQEENLLPFCWSADEGTLARDFPIKKGDIVLFHVRSSSLAWIKRMREVTSLTPVAMDKFLPRELSEVDRFRLDKVR